MECLLKSILVPDKGSITSKEICHIARYIAPKKRISHQEVWRFLTANYPKVKITKTTGGSSSLSKYKFNEMRLVSASELAQKAELILFAVIWEEFEAAIAHIKWNREFSMDHPCRDIERAISGYAGERRVMVIKVKRRRMESAYGAALAALQMASDCQNVAKISFVAGPFEKGTICILAPEREDAVVFDKFEADGESVIKAKVGLPNGKLLNWSYKLSGERNLQYRLE